MQATWNVEGLAEFYALEILVRWGTTSPRRHPASLEDVARWESSPKRAQAAR